MKYINPYLSNKLYPTLSELQSAFRAADNPDERTRDVRPLMSILERMSIASPRLSGNLLTRRTALQSYEWDIINEENPKAESIKPRVANAINAIIRHYVNLPAFGAFAISFVWHTQKDLSRITAKVHKVYSPVELEKNGQSLKIVDTLSNNVVNKIDVSTLSPQEIIWAVDEKEWIGGILRSVAIHEILRNETYQEWANFNRKLKGLIQALAEEAEKGDASNALKSFLLNNYTVTSKEVEFRFNELTNPKGAESYSAFLQKIEDDIAIAILGQANTTQLPNHGGSRAALQILDLIRKDIHYSDINNLTEIINTFLLYDYQLNVKASAYDCPYKFSFKFDEVPDIEANARMIEIAIRSGIPLNKNEAYYKLGLTPPKQDDELLEVEPVRGYAL